MRPFAYYLAAEVEMHQRELLEDARHLRVRAPVRRRRSIVQAILRRFGRPRA